jgi:hypothetical protein
VEGQVYTFRQKQKQKVKVKVKEEEKIWELFIVKFEKK